MGASYNHFASNTIILNFSIWYTVFPKHPTNKKVFII
jgi:hypothetical protein